MRLKTNTWKRALSAFLSFVMVLGMIPAFDIVPEAEAAPTNASSYITMPITIRDFAADGMLFEFNQVGATGTAGATETSTYGIYAINAAGKTWNDDGAQGVFIYTANNYDWEYTSVWRLCIICKADGTIVKVIPSGTKKGDTSANTGVFYENMPSNGYSVWLAEGYSNYGAFATITDSNKGNYKLTYSGSTLTMTVGGGGQVYNQANTAGFSLLTTTSSTSTGASADFWNNLAYNDTTAIPGTTLIENGSWGMTSDPTAKTTTLNSGAKQEVYGAWIRTNLVEATLDKDGKPIYTEATLDYLAKYMQKAFTVKYQEANGSYNTYYVLGTKMFDANKNYVGPTSSAAVHDLADIFRGNIKTDGSALGTYDDAKAKFEAGNLTLATQAKTWYEAAYFLLHNTWRDSTADADQIGSDGYGMPIDNYDSLHLVQTTNEKGETCYVFNSKYDDTVYDPYAKEIYNTQTTNFTIAKTASDGNKDTYVRGNPLPDARFDPLGWSGSGLNQGYGISGDVYGDMVGESNADWADYYDNTNYNLSLEGHAQFIYYENSDMYFTFTGDDDVYLYVNGIRVLDVGAAHSISKVKINLNDVAEMCGLRDGKAYTFDFFYMERHGTAANFGIETNIQIVDPAMTTNKTGYQNGVSTGYNGYVDPNTKVGYSFELQNRGENKIEDLTFTDDDIGIKFTKDAITLNSDSKMEEMYLYLFNADGTIKEMYLAGKLTEDILKEKLDVGLEVGEKIGIYGFKYKIPEDKWVDNVFPNTVYTTAIAVGDSSTQTLTGIAEWKVQKSTLVTTPFHVYDWVAKNVSQNPETTCDWYSPEGATVKVTKSELVQPIKVAGVTVPSGVNIVLCSASGNESGVNLNPNATVDSDGSITYTSTKPGLDTVYYKVKGMNYDSIVFHYDVYTYGTVNNVYVLDYGLAVELNGDEFGLRANDYLNLTQNIKGATVTVTGVQDATSNYGTFIWDTTTDPYSLKYTPKDIIDDTDSVRANVQILENGATEVTKFTGVNMYELITTVPANVVYYEENHPGITYVNTDENQWVHYETVDEDGNSVAGTEQSADQDSNYGSDPNYMEDKVGEIVSGESVGTVVDHTTLNLDTSDLDALQASGIEYLNEYMGLGGSDSNGTVNQLVVNETAEVLFFEFVGTGFEIVSRTTADAYAVINVQVQKKNDDGTYTIVRQKPVITESIGGDLYQVPIISITGLDKAEYRVVVKAAGSTANKTRVLYIDGIRIYGPLSDDQALEYYNPEEYQAEFFEVKQLIQAGQAIYADASETDDDLMMVTGTTLVENTGEDPENGGVLSAIEDVDAYMSIGPNNELYLDGNSATGMLAFFLTPIKDYPDAARTLEIGAHRKSDSSADDNGYVVMTYASHAQDIIGATYSYNVASGTEMYYSIDVDNLTLNEETGKYVVMIGTNGSEYYGTTLALTSIKVAGYTITFAEEAIQTAYEENDLLSTPIVAEPFAVLTARLSAVEEEPEVEQIPVNENLTITSAGLRATKVVSGKVANMTVKASADAETIVVTDSEGNVVEPTRCVRKVSGDVVTFTFIWNVTGSRGEVLDYIIRVYDANGLASVNTESVTVTIK